MVCQSCHIPHDVQQVCETLVRSAGSGTQVMGWAPEPRVDPLLGAFVGSFRIIRRIGGGGMGTVYLAEHRSIGSRVAIKVLHPHLAQHQSLVSRFRAEALAVNLIGHENIVSIFDLGTMEGGRHYLVMEYLEGRQLSELGAAARDPAVFVPILAQVCEALSAAHHREVIHRDLKPENIFLTRRGGAEHFVKLLDFGIAKLAETDMTPQTTAGMIVGTPEYMAPEQFVGAQIDGRADLYALGTIAYQLATGLLPFSAGNLAAMMLAHRELKPQPPHLLNKRIPVKLSEVILKALSKRPEHRFEDAAQMRHALLEAVKPEAPALAPVVAPKAPSAYAATVYSNAGQELRRVKAQDLSRGGVFLCAETFTPALLARLRVRIEARGGALELSGEVVRHVSPVQSAAWGMPPGVGVQWTELTADERKRLERVLAGESLAVETPVPSNAQLEAQLLVWKRRGARDHYTVLAAPEDADFDTLRTRGREAKHELELLKHGPLTAEQTRQVEHALTRVSNALHTLGNAERRAEYDASRGNYRGVARCIAAGLTVTQLEQARNRFLPTRPGSESRARIQATSAEAHLVAGNLAGALDCLERALAEDPLTLRYHQRYWNLRRQATPQPNATSR